jgi:hypothetical protein
MATPKQSRRRMRRPPPSPPPSELELLTTDPTLAKHPDPRLHPKFRNADESCDEEAVGVGGGPPRRLPQPAWFDSKAWGRSPKE